MRALGAGSAEVAAPTLVPEAMVGGGKLNEKDVWRVCD